MALQEREAQQELQLEVASILMSLLRVREQLHSETANVIIFFFGLKLPHTDATEGEGAVNPRVFIDCTIFSHKASPKSSFLHVIH